MSIVCWKQWPEARSITPGNKVGTVDNIRFTDLHITLTSYKDCWDKLARTSFDLNALVFKKLIRELMLISRVQNLLFENAKNMFFI